MLTIIMGRTRSGKLTIVEEPKKYGFHLILTTTIRPKRKKEIQNANYHFAPEEEFLEKIDQNYSVEYKAYKIGLGIWYYGSAREGIESAGEKGIITLTPEGYGGVVREYLSLEYRLVYIYVNNQTIKNRLTKRGDRKEEAERRTRQDYQDSKGVGNLADRTAYNNEDNEFSDVVDKLWSYLEENSRE